MKKSYTEEMEERFILRTRAHLYLVRKWSDRIKDYDHEHINPYLLDRERDVHDQTKFEEVEKEPYVWITWRYYKKRTAGEDIDLPEGMSEKMHEATFHHIKNNKHHPEYWDDKVTIDSLNPKDRDKPSETPVNAKKMPLTYVAAMCADWFAVSEELNTDPREWAKSNINVRWLFTKEQEDLVYRLIRDVWEV